MCCMVWFQSSLRQSLLVRRHRLTVCGTCEPRLWRLLDDIFSSYTWSFLRFGYLPSKATQRLRVASAVLCQ